MKIDGGLSDLFRGAMPTVHWQRIETSTGLGVPDMNGCVIGKEFWIEFKKADGWVVGLRPEQVAWHMHRSRVGGRTFIALRRAPKRYDELWLIPGHLAVKVKREDLRDFDQSNLIIGSGGPKIWNWELVFKRLTA